MPHRLPLFPLKVVAFPGLAMPLHIFEPRYRRLLADCLAGDGGFGLVPVGEGGEAPSPGSVGCLMRIARHEALPDGRANIIVTGERRFLLTRYLDEGTPYYLGMVEEFDDDPGSAPAPDLVAAVRELAEAYLGLLRRISDGSVDLTLDGEDALTVGFAIAAALQCDESIKRRLLELRSTRERFEMLATLLPPLSAALADAVRVHEGARRNGKGGHHPDIVIGG